MKERDFLNWVIQCAERTGWKVYHVPAPMVADRRTNTWRPFRKAAGLPDLFLLHADPPRMIIAEVKGTGGKLTAKQREFLSFARDVADEAQGGDEHESYPPLRPVGVYAWHPDQQEIIENILKSKTLI